MNKNDFFIKFRKGIPFLLKNIMFLNVRDKNIKNLAYREYCYKKLKKKYVDLVKNSNYVLETKNEISNYIWICWFQGYDNAPDLVKRCIDSVRKFFPKYEIIIISLENFKDFVEIHPKIVKKFQKGIISYAHFSDILRLELLIKYGGLWIDSTVLVTDKPKKSFFDNELFVYKNVSLDKNSSFAAIASNWLIYSCKNNPILLLTRDLLYKYWETHNLLMNYNIFHIFFKISTEKYEKIWNKVPTYSNIPPHLLQLELLNEFHPERWSEIKKMSCFHKLNYRIITEDKNSFYHYIIND